MNKFINPKCQKCGHYQKPEVCLLKNTQINPEGLCHNYTESPFICEVCGKHLIAESVNYTTGIESPFHIVCINCLHQMYTCGTCIEAQTCKFENDQTIPEPAYVMQTIQQGPVISQMQVKNPKRINLTCKVNCPCFVDGDCIRAAGGYCDKYKCAVKNW